MQSLLYFGGRGHSTHDPAQYEQRQNYMLASPFYWTHRTQFDADPLMDLWKYVHRVWTNEHDVPEDEAALLAISRETLLQDHEAFIAQGGKVRHGGSTLEEVYLGLQLALHTSIACLINNQQILQPTTRIHHMALLDPHVLLTFFVQALEAGTFEKSLHRSIVGIAPFIGYEQELGRNYFQTLTYDGEIAHCINVLGIDQHTHNLVYYDTWPGDSLLSRTESKAGIAAIPYINRTGERLWMITPDDLEQVIYAVMMPARQWDQILRGAGYEKAEAPSSRRTAPMVA